MVYLRYPGQVLSADEQPHGILVNLVAEQIGVPVDVWEGYATREETRREHVLELLARLGMKQFGSAHYRFVSAWLESTALQTTRGMVLAQAAVDELRRRLIVLPSVEVIERLCAEAATRAQRKVFSLLTGDLSEEQRIKLDELLEPRKGSPYSTLAWLRLPAGAPTPKAVLAHIERLRAVREIGLASAWSARLERCQWRRENWTRRAYGTREEVPA